MTMVNRLASAVYPQFFPAHWLDDIPNLVHSAFPSRIRIGYVIRGEGCYEFVLESQLAESGSTLDDLHRAAISNLGRLPLPDLRIAKTPGGPEVIFTEVNDNFAAARLLLPILQQELAKELGDSFYLSIPCRDWWVSWHCSQSAEWQERNCKDALDAFISDEYNLTPDILIFSGSTFALHQSQEVAG